MGEYTHMSREELIHLLLYFVLTVRVDGQQVAGEAQGAAAGFVARQEEDKRLTHDLILSDHLFLRSPAVGLLVRGRWLRWLVPGIELIGVVQCIEVLHRHRLFAGSSIQHQLEEVSTPLQEN